MLFHSKKRAFFGIIWSFTYWNIKHFDPQILKTKHFLRVSPELASIVFA